MAVNLCMDCCRLSGSIAALGLMSKKSTVPLGLRSCSASHRVWHQTPPCDCPCVALFAAVAGGRGQRLLQQHLRLPLVWLLIVCSHWHILQQPGHVQQYQVRFCFVSELSAQQAL